MSTVEPLSESVRRLYSFVGLGDLIDCDHCGSSEVGTNTETVSGRDRLVFKCASCGSAWARTEGA